MNLPPLDRSLTQVLPAPRRKGSLRSSVWSIACLFLPIPLVLAQEPPAASGRPARLEELSDRFQNSPTPVVQKARDLLALVDSEASAKRIPEPLAQGLRWTLETVSSNEGVDVLSLFESTRMPLEDAAIMEAARVFEDAARAAQAERAALKAQAVRDAARRCGELVRNCQATAEIDAFLPSVERFQKLTKKYPDHGATPMPASDLSPCAAVLRSLRGVIALEAAGDPLMIRDAVSQFQRDSSAAPEFVSAADFGQRDSTILAFFQHAADAARDYLAAALIQGKPYDQVSLLSGKFTDATNRYSGSAQILAPDFSNTGSRACEATWQAFGAVADASGFVASHQWSKAEGEMARARESLPHMAPEQAIALEALLQEMEPRISAAANIASRDFQAELHAKLSAVKQPSDLAAIAIDLSKRQRDLPGGEDSWIAQGLGKQISALAAAWSSEDLNLLVAGNLHGGSVEDAEFAALRERIERKILGRSIDVPELDREPFASLPVLDAIDRLQSKLAAESKWPQALLLLEAENVFKQLHGATPRNPDAIFAVRSYLAGKNLEAAGLWAEAAAAYKSVLAMPAAHTPVAAAAERLKALAKAHPAKAARPRPQTIE